MYTAEAAERITRLRHERWNLLARFGEKHGNQDGEWTTMNKRMAKINSELYELTGHEIYNG